MAVSEQMLYPNDLKMQTSELHQRAQVKLNDGRNGHSYSTSLGILS